MNRLFDISLTDQKQNIGENVCRIDDIYLFFSNFLNDNDNYSKLLTELIKIGDLDKSIIRKKISRKKLSHFHS